MCPIRSILLPQRPGCGHGCVATRTPARSTWFGGRSIGIHRTSKPRSLNCAPMIFATSRTPSRLCVPLLMFTSFSSIAFEACSFRSMNVTMARSAGESDWLSAASQPKVIRRESRKWRAIIAVRIAGRVGISRGNAGGRSGRNWCFFSRIAASTAEGSRDRPPRGDGLNFGNTTKALSKFHFRHKSCQNQLLSRFPAETVCPIWLGWAYPPRGNLFTGFVSGAWCFNLPGTEWPPCLRSFWIAE